MMTRSQLHQIVDALAEDEVDSAAELLDAYRRGDRALIQLLTAPESPAEPDELDALAELTEEDLGPSKAIPANEVWRRHGVA